MIILLLLLLNAASLYWFTQRPPVAGATAEAPAIAPAGVARLSLLTEVSPDALIPADAPSKTGPVAAGAPPTTPEAMAAADRPPKTPPAAPVRKPFCFITPPFAPNAGDDGVLRTLAHIPDVEVNTTPPEPTVESTTHWVRLIGFRPLKEAMALLKELHGKGINDVATTPVKDRGTVVSLGLYRLAQSAEDRLREIRNMGYDAEIVELKKTRPGQRYRINILARSENQARGYLREYSSAFPEHPPELQECPEQADGHPSQTSAR